MESQIARDLLATVTLASFIRKFYRLSTKYFWSVDVEQKISFPESINQLKINDLTLMVSTLINDFYMCFTYVMCLLVNIRQRQSKFHKSTSIAHLTFLSLTNGSYKRNGHLWWMQQSYEKEKLT